MKITTVLAVIASLVLTGCGGTRNWKEEVRLADGRTIVVDRWEKLGNPLDREIPDLKYGPPTVGHGIRIPSADKWVPVLWETDSTLTPLAIGFRGETIYLAASPRFCWAYDQLGRPEPPYVFFKYEGKEWQRIPVEEFPEEIKQANLLVGSNAKETATGEISAAFTEQSNRSLSANLRNIYRSGTKGWNDCIREINAGWYKNQTSK